MRIPQSTRSRRPDISSNVHDAPTSSAPPRNVNLAMCWGSLCLQSLSDSGTVCIERRWLYPHVLYFLLYDILSFVANIDAHIWEDLSSMSYQQELLDLIAPEYLSLPHELRLYQGLEETGETSLERARENGFYRVAKVNDERPALFLHESQFEVFGQLILEVSRLRRLQEDTEDERTEPEEDLEDVDAEVSFDEDVEMLPEFLADIIYHYTS